MTDQLEDVSPRIEAYLENAADPDAVTVGLHRLAEAGADPRPHLESWMKLIDASPAAVETLVTRPHLVRELPETGGAYERDRFERELAEALQNLPDRQSRLFLPPLSC